LCLSSAASAQALSASATIGLGVPIDGLFRDVYGDVLTPIALQADVALGDRGLLAFGGVRHVRRSGEAVIEASAGASGQAVRFRMTTARFGLGWRLARGDWTVGLAGGPTYNFFREEWEDFDLVTDDRSVGFVGQASLSRAIRGRVEFLLRGEYSWAAAESAQDPTLPEANLGAIDLAAGIAWRF